MTEIVDIAVWRRSYATSDPGSSDALARRQAIETDTSFLVEAPAGSGKTGLLIQRYLALLGSAGVAAPEQVLAITFTRAATEEIRTRVLRELRSAHTNVEARNEFEERTRVLAHTVLARDAEFGWNLLANPLRLRVTTIDGLCAELVRSVQSGIGGASTWRPVENAQPLYQEAARRTMLRLGETGTPEENSLTQALRNLLLHRDGDLSTTESLLAEMLARREQWGRLLPTLGSGARRDFPEDDALSRLNQALARTICSHLEHLVEQFPAGLLDQLAGIAAELALTERHGRRSTHPFLLCRDLVGTPPVQADLLEQWKAMLAPLLTGAGTWRKGFAAHHLGVKLSKEQGSALKEIVDLLAQRHDLLETVKTCLKLPPALYPEKDWDFTRDLLRVLDAAVAELSEVFRTRRSCDFAEFSILARRALEAAATGGEVLESQDLTKHLLLDEMQDTSYSQYDLLERFTTGWDGWTRTVFLVGDPKQSIYLFRQARVERFVAIAAQQRFGDIPLVPLQLSANFRSQSGLIDAANETFSHIFPDSSRPGRISYSPVAATRAAMDLGREASFAWHLSELPGSLEEQRESRVRAEIEQARTVRRTLEDWLARPLPPGRTAPWRLAVLVQKREALKRITRELRAGCPLPYRAIEIEPLRERREILDVLALTRALLHPADRIAWLSVLRAPWCGLMLADLHQLTGADDTSFRSHTVLELLTERSQCLSRDGAQRIACVAPVLLEAVGLLGEVRLPELVERTWRALGAEQYLDSIAQQNVGTVLKLMRTIDREQGYLDTGQLEQRIDRLRAASTAGAQIELMTIHGAKGLEWDVVILPELDRRSPAPDQELLQCEELDGGGGVLLAPVQKKGEASSQLQQWLRHVHAKRLEAERSRLFYVAATRAREQLHLFSSVSLRKGGTPESGSLLHAAWPAAREHLAAEPPRTTLSLAAVAEDAVPPRQQTPAVLERVPIGEMSAQKSYSRADPTSLAQSEDYGRQGSPLSRAIGNVVHVLLERAAMKAPHDATPGAATHEDDRAPRQISVLLRQEGVGEKEVATAAERVREAIRRTQGSALGRWILGSQVGGRAEWAMTHWNEQRRRLRADRIFFGGDEPGVPGQDQLWVIDYKTSMPGALSLPAFFEREQAMYRDQLEQYSAALREAGGISTRVALGLWFPYVAKLIWWLAPLPGTLAVSAWHVAE